jgi:hypothetical protein
MRRTSKRQIRMKLAPAEELCLAVDNFDPGAGVVMIDGVACRLFIRRRERMDLSRQGGLRVRVVSVPEAGGDGWLPKGARETDENIPAFVRQLNRRPVRIESEGYERNAACEDYAAFARQFPVGSLVGADVLWVRRDKIGLRLAPGIETRMPVGDFVDRPSGWRRQDLYRLPIPDRIEVIVRRVCPERKSVTVSLHGYMQDLKYCSAAAGYRSGYDAREGMFRLLPWERDTPEGNIGR